jgi:hypothetical protein
VVMQQASLFSASKDLDKFALSPEPTMPISKVVEHSVDPLLEATAIL